MTIDEIVLNMREGSPEYDKPMTLELAEEDVRNIRLDAANNGEELPEDLTPERYMEVWNDFLKMENREDALRVLRLLREAQSDLLDAGFDFMNNHSRLEQALTLIGDTMDDISREYDLPIMSEQ